MGVSKNSGTPKSSILIGFSIINHPFWGTPIFGNIHIVMFGKLGGVSSELKLNSKAVELLVVDTERPFDLSMEVGSFPTDRVSERLFFL